MEQADRAVKAGARFIVSPGFDPEIVDDCLSKGIPVFPGCVTPSEVAQAVKRGLEVVKFFPAEDFRMEGNRMGLNLRPQKECTYDAVSLGEVMLRLDPGEGRIRTARNFRVWEGGGEYNVVRGLRRCFGMKTAVLTAFAENEVGMLLEDLVLQGGVDISLIKWMKTDGIGRTCRNGLNFTERGFGIRGAVGCSDRANTAISKARPEDFNFEHIFGELGVRWFHTGGIYAALLEQSSETVMWEAIVGQAKAQEVNKEIAKYVDVMIGNEEDFTACLGLEVEGNSRDLKELNLKGYKKMIDQAAKIYPNFKAVATTLRTVKTATENDWGAICWSDGEIYQSKDYKALEILDRVGSGDSFASGFIYGLMTAENAETAVNYGAAQGALAMTTPGDTTMVNKKEVESVMNGAGARVKR